VTDLALAIAVREDLTRGARALMVTPAILALAKLLRRRFRRQKRWLEENGGESLNLYPEDLKAQAQMESILTTATRDGWGLAAAELGLNYRTSIIMPALFLAGIDRTTEDRIAKDGLTKAFSDIQERSQLIAMTEVGDAFNMGALALSEMGTGVEKAWNLQGEACPVCIANAAEGYIPQSMPFGSGHQAPTAHPRCMCSLSFRMGLAVG
jgi:hypothetical protein